MTAPPAGRAAGRWRLLLATVGYIAWAPLALAGLPFAALVLASRPQARAPWVIAPAVGVLSAYIIVASGGLVGAFTGAFVVLVTAAFVAGAVLDPLTLWRQSLRATVLGGVAVAGLARLLWGATWWPALQQQMSHEATIVLRPLVTVLPEAGDVAIQAVAFTSATIPAQLALQSLAGLALAWQWHVSLSDRPLGEPAAPFREFRFGDAWVWGIVVAVTIWLVPWFADLKTVALNLAVLLGALYLLRGAAVVTAFAAAAGLSASALVAAAVVAAVLFVPLLFLVPGLWALGITDTWLEFRRRLAERGRPNAT